MVIKSWGNKGTMLVGVGFKKYNEELRDLKGGESSLIWASLSYDPSGNEEGLKQTVW